MTFPEYKELQKIVNKKMKWLLGDNDIKALFDAKKARYKKAVQIRQRMVYHRTQARHASAMLERQCKSEVAIKKWKKILDSENEKLETYQKEFNNL